MKSRDSSTVSRPLSEALELEVPKSSFDGVKREEEAQDREKVDRQRRNGPDQLDK